METRNKSSEKKKPKPVPLLPYRPFRPLRRAVTPPKKQSDELRARLEAFFLREVYRPLLSGLGVPLAVENRSGPSSQLRAALASGRVTFHRGVFSGSFNLGVTKELRGIGAEWDPSTETFRLASDELPPELKAAVAMSETAFQSKVGRMAGRIEKVLGASPWQSLAVASIFKTAAFRMDADFRVNVGTLSVQPKLTDFEATRVAEEYTFDLRREIKAFTQQEMAQLRQRVEKAYLSGDRYGALEKMIQRSYGVSQRKAEFLARQETNLLCSEYQEAKYVEAGVDYYLWRCVPGTAEHPTRPRHKELSAMSDRGVLFRFDDPPVTTEPGQPQRRNNPLQDFNCRCAAHPVVLPAGARIIRLGDSTYRVKAA